MYLAPRLIGIRFLSDDNLTLGIATAPFHQRSPVEGDGKLNGGIKMHWIMTTLMIAGFVFAGMSGMVFYMGEGMASHHLSGLQLGELCIANPCLCMSGGVVMLVLGLIGQPGRIQ